MDSRNLGNILKHPNPRENASTTSILTWWWSLGIFNIKFKTKLNIDDVHAPLKEDESRRLGDKFERQWDEISQNNSGGQYTGKTLLLKTIVRTFLKDLVILLIVHFILEILRLGTPLLLSKFLVCLNLDEGDESYTYDAKLYAGGIIASIVVSMVLQNQATFMAFHLGSRIKTALCSILYRKVLRLRKTTLDKETGKIINFINTDVTSFDMICLYIPYLAFAPVFSLITCYLIYLKAGFGAIGVCPLFPILVIQFALGRWSKKFMIQSSIETDKRVKLMEEIISSIRVIKMYAWERPFYKLIEKARNHEILKISRSSYIECINKILGLLTNRIALFCATVSMMYADQENLTAINLYVIFILFGNLTFLISQMFVDGLFCVHHCMVAIGRLQRFMLYEEFDERNVVNVKRLSYRSNIKQVDLTMGLVNKHLGYGGSQTLSPQHNNYTGTSMSASRLNESWAVKIESFSAKWHSESQANVLDKLSIQFEKGRLYVIIGRVGAGKSTLLSSILGETKVVEGRVRINGYLSYASQDPWIFGSSIKQNILFGECYEAERYKRVIEVCALVKDFKQLQNGDETIVGERGSSLSGGQKARINLARAIYRQADIYLLDDPLSAVDAHVGKHLFEKCLLGCLAGKTRILVTHQLQYIQNCNGIILVDRGRVKEFLNYNDLVCSYPEYEYLILRETGEIIIDDKTSEKSIPLEGPSPQNILQNRAPVSDEIIKHEEFNNLKNETPDVGFITYLKYFKAGGNFIFTVIVILLCLVTHGLMGYSDYFLHHISVAYKNARNENEDIFFSPVTYTYFGIFAGIVIFGTLRIIIFYWICMRSSRRLHNRIFEALMGTGMRFFDKNSSGEIHDRFTKEMSTIDGPLPNCMLFAAQFMLTTIVSMIMPSFNNFYLGIPLLAVITVACYCQCRYFKISKNIKFLEGTARPPVLTHLNNAMNGLPTIRACMAKNILRKEFDQLQDIHTSTSYRALVANTAFGFGLDSLCCMYAVIVVVAIIVNPWIFSSVDTIGFGITQVMIVIAYFQWGFRQSAMMENYMVSVKRILQYSKLPSEPNLLFKTEFFIKMNLPQNWPALGTIEFKKVCMRYSHEDLPVLRDVSFKIEGAEKIGIVGRTGAGKSSLIAALFRLTTVDGVIEIDGINTGSIALEDLRSNIAIIPQDPVLFSGSLKKNLDPFGKYSDKELSYALEKVELKEAAISIRKGVDEEVGDKGTNFSVGERQLLCLARALLRNNRILLLDEATANVDSYTDEIIQKTIRECFKSCTVLTVAHRLNTIMNSDKVMVMHKGNLVEFDHPHILLQNNRGHFRDLVMKTGPATCALLMNAAKESYELKNTVTTTAELEDSIV